MQAHGYRYIFGPVMSGRLGRSLGLDLLGARVCSMNCVYCESGALAHLTLARAPYVPAAELLGELARWEAARKGADEPLPEVVTLGGLGEPTLNSAMPEIIQGVRRILPGVPVAVLTNASLMTEAAVRAELAQADIVLPSLDALVPAEFAAVNRAHPGLETAGGVGAIADGILAFRRDSQAKLYLEILLVAGVNDSARNLELLAEYCNRLQPDRVDVVTLSRPGTEAAARPVDTGTLAHWRARLGTVRESTTRHAGPKLAVCVKSGHKQGGGMLPAELLRTRILASLTRRPQTAAQLAEALLAEEGAVTAELAALLDAGQIMAREQDGQDYYQARTQ